MLGGEAPIFYSLVTSGAFFHLPAKKLKNILFTMTENSHTQRPPRSNRVTRERKAGHVVRRLEKPEQARRNHQYGSMPA